MTKRKICKESIKEYFCNKERRKEKKRRRRRRRRRKKKNTQGFYSDEYSG